MDIPGKAPTPSLTSPALIGGSHWETGCVPSGTYCKWMSFHYFFLRLHPDGMGVYKNNLLWKIVVEAGIG